MPLLDLALLLLGLVLISAKASPPSTQAESTSETVRALSRALGGRALITLCCPVTEPSAAAAAGRAPGCSPLAEGAAPLITADQFRALRASSAPTAEAGWTMLFIEAGNAWAEDEHAERLRRRYGPEGWTVLPVLLDLGTSCGDLTGAEAH
jgi:hypothetical protein